MPEPEPAVSAQMAGELQPCKLLVRKPLSERDFLIFGAYHQFHELSFGREYAA